MHSNKCQLAFQVWMELHKGDFSLVALDSEQILIEGYAANWIFLPQKDI